MNARRHRLCCALIGLALLNSGGVGAAVVTVRIAGHSGVAAESALVIFDPLDAIPPLSHENAVIDQINKKFVPRISIVRTGTSIVFPNSDRIRHQVYSFSTPNVFTLKLYAGSPAAPVAFEHPGLVVLGCNIHDQMVAFVGVVDSPYFAKIPASGASTLNLPIGRYRMRVWHPNETSAVASQTVTVATAPLTIPVTMELDLASGAVAAWPE
jgi:plastocyanin